MLYDFLKIKSNVTKINWPIIPNPLGAQLIAILNYLEFSQWQKPEIIFKQQQLQLQTIYQHAIQTVPFYREKFAGFANINSENFHLNWANIPITTRQEVQKADTRIFSTDIPKEHGNSVMGNTSGSSGRPIKVLGNDLTQFFWMVFTLRDHLWQQRNLQEVLGIIRTSSDSDAKLPLGRKFDNWGEATLHLSETGACYHINPTHAADEVKWLQTIQPSYLLCYPSTLKSILRHIRESNITLPFLKEIRTVSEIVEPSLRELTKELLGIAIKDVYSSKEAGYMALQCPLHEHYHIQSENVFIEILNSDNRPCGPGEIGRVVLTTLHNFASPMIRYEIGDYAEVGEPCACGRGLPVLTQIMGRQRNLIHYPNGKRAWPSLVRDGQSFISLFPQWQYQFIQHSLHLLELKLTCDPCKPEVEQSIKERVQFILDFPFDIKISYVREIEREPSGKFEDFKSLLLQPVNEREESSISS